MSNLRPQPRRLRDVPAAELPEVERTLRPHRHLIWDHLQAEIEALRRAMHDFKESTRIEWNVTQSTDKAFIVTYPAGVPISGHRAVTILADGLVYYADHDTLDDIPNVMGISMNAAVEGDPVDILVFGEMIEPSWSWTERRAIFLGSAGHLTQAPPTTGFLMEVGFAVTPQKIMVELKPAIVLA